MARDDMFVVMCKVIAYLYSRMRKGEEPKIEEYGHEALLIPEEYWIDCIEELVRHGFVSGVKVTRLLGGRSVELDRPTVTMEGVQFARENSMMSRAARFVQGAGGFFGNLVGPFI